MRRLTYHRSLRLGRLGLLFTMLALVLVLTAQTNAATTLSSASVVTDEVQQMVTTTGGARVLLLLGEPTTPSTAVQAAGLTPEQQRAAVAAWQRSVLQTLAPADFQLYRQYEFMPGLAGTISAAGLDRLRQHPLVRAIQLDHPGGAHLQESLPAIGGDVVHNNYGITGQGVTVAVLDSGIDTDHPDLADDLVAQHCFTNSACPPSNTTESNSAEDQNGHGTHVSGVISARGAVSGPGFAPDAKIVAVRVLDRNGSGFVSDWVAGLDWVRSHLATRPVQVVNMSLGTFALYPSNCDVQESLLAAATAQLRARGVVIFASSGNQGSATRIAAPACNSAVIAVGATYDGNVGRQPNAGTYQSLFGSSWPACSDNPTTLQTITCFTNSNQQLDLLAPGAPILSAYLAGQTAQYWGTSQASPTAAGVAALLLERRPGLTPTAVEAILKSSGTAVTNPNNGLSFPLINALAAIKAITPITPTALALTGPVTGITNIAYEFAAAVMPVTATTPITYQWQATDRPAVTTVGTQQNSQPFTWTTPGRKVVTVTARNEGGQVSMTHAITIAAVAPVTATLSGPTVLATGSAGVFTATAAPVTATTPITYAWQRIGALPITHRNGLSDQVALTWEVAGVQTITVTLLNSAGRITITHLVTVQAVAPITVTIDAPLTTTVGLTIPVRAQVQPSGASLPFTYTWQATGLPPLTHTAGLTDTVAYQWPTAGLVTITVVAQNDAGEVANQRTILIVDKRRLYLPSVQRP